MKTLIDQRKGSPGEPFRQDTRWLLEAASGSFIMLVGPRSMNTMMQTVIARLGEHGALRILDGGNRFHAYTVARMARGRPEVLNRITISRAFTCYQVLSLLEGTPAIQVPFVILDLLSTFYDESVQIGERKRLLKACISHLKRLELVAGAGDSCHLHSRCRQEAGSARVLVSVHPPAVASQSALEMLEILQAATEDVYCIQPVAQAPEPLRLF